jgi:hypothetical protein
MNEAMHIYRGSDGDATTAFYLELAKRGAIGEVAVNLFRAQKTSDRAKAYRGRGFRRESYGRKNWSLQKLCDLLEQRAELGIVFGWRQDPGAVGYPWVLYVELPQGQVSFHSAERFAGPAYPGDWDGRRLSVDRVLAFAQSVFEMEALNAN